MIRKIPIKVDRPSDLTNRSINNSKVTITTTNNICTNCSKQSILITNRSNHRLCSDCAKAFDLAKNYCKSILYSHNVPAGVINLLT